MVHLVASDSLTLQGQVLCNGACTFTQADPNNCGACGNACGPGGQCINSQCRCPAGSTNCNNRCVQLTTDPANCGACNRAMC